MKQFTVENTGGAYALFTGMSGAATLVTLLPTLETEPPALWLLFEDDWLCPCFWFDMLLPPVALAFPPVAVLVLVLPLVLVLLFVLLFVLVFVPVVGAGVGIGSGKQAKFNPPCDTT